MGGIELREDMLVVDRPPNDLDELALAFSRLLSDHGVEHVFVAGYVAILAGRARATQDIDVIVERISDETVQSLVSALESAGFWGPAMPLAEMSTMLSNDEPIWIARQDEVAPHIEVKPSTDRFDRASLEHRIRARIGGEELPIGPLELQIAYKLSLGTRTDFEDAVHLFTLFAESLSTEELERWVRALDVGSEYDRLERA